MEKLNFFGIGPKVATIFIPWLAATIIISSIFKERFLYSAIAAQEILIGGIALMFLGLVFYFSTVRLLLTGLKQTKLIKTGPYSLCQNPLYTSIALLIIPALSLILNSWLVLTSSLVGYILFKIFIRTEYNELEKFFGEEYRRYRDATPEFFPFPIKKIFRVQRVR